MQEITEISRSLKVMGRRAQRRRDRLLPDEPHGGEPPQSPAPALRPQGQRSIEQDADIVAFIHREDLYTTEEEWSQTHPGQEYPRNIAEIIVAKNRKGPTGSIRLEFRDHLVRFDSMSRMYAS